MKRLFTVLLCLALLLTAATACKPDNITYPSQVITPEEEAGAGEEETPAADDAGTSETGEEADSGTSGTGEEAGAGESGAETEGTADNAGATENAETADDAEAAGSLTAPNETGIDAPPLTDNPLAAEGYTANAKTASVLPLSGMVKNETGASELKDKTLTFYTAGDQPAFSYTDEEGQTVNEWEWMSRIAEENGSVVQYKIKSDAVSLKAQRIALYAGHALSLVQLRAEELASGLTLTRSASALLDTSVSSFGVSKTVLSQSDNRLLAPVGNVNALWYNPELMPEGTDPQTLSQSGSWTVEQFKAVYNNAAAREKLPLLMTEPLAWATLSGRSPLTLADGLLDSNINVRVTRETWTLLKTTFADLADFTHQEGTTYSLQAENTAMAYTAIPAAAEKATLRYAALPAAAEGTSGTVTFTGPFFALPKYAREEGTDCAALQFAELWCNRYTEVLAEKLRALSITGSAYQTYCAFAEEQGMLILHAPDIEEVVEPYLAGLTDPSIDMDSAYAAVSDQVTALIAAKNLYY